MKQTQALYWVERSELDSPDEITMPTPLPNSLSEAGHVLATDRDKDPAEHCAAVILGREGGQSTSPAKQAAARSNGMLGGRPSGS